MSLEELGGTVSIFPFSEEISRPQLIDFDKPSFPLFLLAAVLQCLLCISYRPEGPSLALRLIQ